MSLLASSDTSALKTCALSPGKVRQVPLGHLIVAHYEVVGRVFSKATRPGRTIDWLLVVARPCASQGPKVRSSLRDGAIFYAVSHHFVVGYYQMSLPPSPFGLWRTGRDEVLSECCLAFSWPTMASRRTESGFSLFFLSSSNLRYR